MMSFLVSSDGAGRAAWLVGMALSVSFVETTGAGGVLAVGGVLGWRVGRDPVARLDPSAALTFGSSAGGSSAAGSSPAGSSAAGSSAAGSSAAGTSFG